MENELMRVWQLNAENQHTGSGPSKDVAEPQ